MTDEPKIEMTKAQFEEALSGIADGMSATAEKTAGLAAAVVLEHFAEIIAKMQITANSEAARYGAEYAIRQIIMAAQKLAHEMRDLAETPPSAEESDHT